MQVGSFFFSFSFLFLLHFIYLFSFFFLPCNTIDWFVQLVVIKDDIANLSNPSNSSCSNKSDKIKLLFVEFMSILQINWYKDSPKVMSEEDLDLSCVTWVMSFKRRIYKVLTKDCL